LKNTKGESIPYIEFRDLFKGNMAAAIPPSIGSLEDLQGLLTKLGINEKLPVFKAANPTSNPIDVFRSYIAEELSKITGAERDRVYESIEWTQDFKKGDLILAVPRLRIKGNPAELGKERAEKVYSPSPIGEVLIALITHTDVSLFFLVVS